MKTGNNLFCTFIFLCHIFIYTEISKVFFLLLLLQFLLYEYLSLDNYCFILEYIDIDPMQTLADISEENSANRRWCVKCCSSIDCPAIRTGTNWITAIIQAFYNYGLKPRLSWKVNCIQNIIWHMDFSERNEIEDLERLWTLPCYVEHIC